MSESFIQKPIKLFHQQLISLENNYWKKYKSNIKPSLWQHDYLIHSALVSDIKNALEFVKKKSKHQKLKIIDIGCGQKPYLSFFQNITQEYIGVDNSKNADIIGVAENLPVKSSGFDLSFCTQTFEHTADPVKAVAEIYRVTKKGGFVILTTLGIWIHHPQPHDYYRWTDEGLRHLFKGFKKVVVKPELGSYASILQLINLELYTIACNRLWLKIPLYLLIFLINLIGNNIKKNGRSKFSINYLVLAQK